MIVGRETEQATLTELLAGACSHQGQALVVRGEAGVGKTVLLDHTAAEATHTHGMRVLRCSGVESEVEQAFSGLHQLLRLVLDHLTDVPAAQAAALRGALGIADTAARDLLVSAGVLSLLAAAARDRPLLVVADDAQWLDRATAAALVFAARRIEAEPVAILLAARDHEHPTVDTSDLPTLRLGGLGPADAERLLAERGWTPPHHARAAILAATGGNPLALTELAAGADPDRLLTDLALTGTVPVGDRLRAAFLRRLTALPGDCRAALLVASAEETGDTRTVFGAAARLGLTADAVGPAERAGLVHVRGSEIRFYHPLVRSTAYADAHFELRRATHEAIAAELAANSEPERAVWHRAVVATEPDEKLASALEQSADAARRRGGEAAAASVLQRAARLSESTAARRDRTVAAAFVALDSGQPDLARDLAETVLAEPVPEVTLAQLTGMVELYSGDPAVSHTHLLRCGELLSATDPEEAAWMFVLAVSAAFHAGDLHGTIGAAARVADLDCSPATRLAGQDMAEGGTLTGPRLWELVGALAQVQPAAGGRPWMWATVLGWLGPDPHHARQLAEETARRLHAIGATAQLAELHYYQADIESRLGQWDAAGAYAEEGLRFTRETGQRTWAANHLAMLAGLAAARGAGTDCRRFAEQALDIALPLRERLAAATATAALGLLALGEGEADEACDHLVQVFTDGSDRSHPSLRLASITALTEAAVRARRPDVARGPLDGVAAWVASHPSPAATAAVQHCRALLDSGTGTTEEHFRRALAVPGGAELPFHHGRVALHYGEWLRRNQRRAQARIQLRAAAAAFDGLGATPWSKRARAELRAAGDRSRRAGPAAADRLSAQELEVARLAARGLSNREIAERLFLSPRTVGSHLYRLFPKLGISTRSQLRGLDLE